MRGWLAIGAGVVLLAAALTIEAPATLIDARVAALTDGRIRVAAATGSLWNGAGDLTLIPDSVRIPIAWHLEPMSLLRGGLAGSVTAADAKRPATFAVAAEDFSVHDLAIALPAAAVLRTAGAPAALTVAAGGTLALDVADLARHGDRLEAHADLRWKDAVLAAPPNGLKIALGDIHLAAAGSGGEIPATLSNTGGEVDLAGRLVFSTGGAPQVDARIRPRAGLPAPRREAIESLLSSIGRADGSGAYRIVWPLNVR